MAGQMPPSSTVDALHRAPVRRGFRGIVGAVVVSLALWACLMMGVLGLILKILG